MQDLKNRWPTSLFSTHSFANFSSPNEIEKYLDFLDNWYENHQSELQSGELEKFKNKVEGVRKEWPFKVSHLVLLGMRRQSKPDKRYLLKVAFIQKVLMYLSFPQTDKPYYFPGLEF